MLQALPAARASAAGVWSAPERRTAVTPFRRRSRCSAAAIVLGLVLVTLLTSPAGAGVTPAFSHVFVILMENHEFGDIIGNPAAPFINSLAHQYALATNYTAVTHPSLPNYMALTSGDTFFTTDCSGCTTGATSVVDLIEAASRSWRAYMEDMPAACTTTSSGLYDTDHNPFVHDTTVVSNATRCQQHVVPFTGFASDLGSGALPDFVWITPNINDDMHDGTIAAGDAWLANVVPQILGARAFDANAVLFIVWDEGTSSIGGGGRVPLLVVSRLAVTGLQSATPATHYSLLRTITDGLRLPALGQAQSAAALTDFFVQPSAGTPTPSTPPSPAVASWHSGRLDLFMRGPDNTLRHRYYSGAWSDWENLGGYVLSDPGAVSWGAGRIDVVARGADNAVWHLWYDNGWASWESLGGFTFDRPSLASWGPGRLDVLVRGADGQLWHRYYAGAWSSWEALGGVLASGPAAVSFGVGRLDVFVQGMDGGLYQKTFDGGWRDYVPHGGVLGDAPGVSSWGLGRLDVFVKGADGTLWHQWYDNGTTSNVWEGLGDGIPTAPTAVSWGPSRIDVFAGRGDGTLLHRWFDGSWASESMSAPP